MAMWASNVVGGIGILVIGLIIRLAKASSLIAGYNTMPKHEKAKYDEEALTRFVGNMLIVAVVLLLLPLVAVPFVDAMPAWVVPVSWGLFVAVIIGGMVYANTGNRFRKERSESGS